MLAFLPDAEANQLLARLPLRRYTQRTIVTLPALKGELRRVRHSGFALDNEEREPGRRCIGAPIMDNHGRVIASLSIGGQTGRFGRTEVPAIVSALIAAASDLSATLGYDKHAG